MTLLIFAALVFLIGYTPITDPPKKAIQEIVAILGIILWLLVCFGAINLPACLR